MIPLVVKLVATGNLMPSTSNQGVARVGTLNILRKKLFTKKQNTQPKILLCCYRTNISQDRKCLSFSFSYFCNKTTKPLKLIHGKYYNPNTHYKTKKIFHVFIKSYVNAAPYRSATRKSLNKYSEKESQIC